MVKKFNDFSVNESKVEKGGEITLYRLSSHPVINLNEPGNFYVKSKSKLDPSLLKKKGGNLYTITVKCDASNINLDKSEIECAKLDNNSVVVVKDDKKCELVKIEPFSK